MSPDELRAVANDPDLMEIGRLAIEDELIEWRDSRRFTLRNNGFSIRKRDGSGSELIRFGPEVGVRLALLAIADAMAEA